MRAHISRWWRYYGFPVLLVACWLAIIGVAVALLVAAFDYDLQRPTHAHIIEGGVGIHRHLPADAGHYHTWYHWHQIVPVAGPGGE